MYSKKVLVTMVVQLCRAIRRIKMFPGESSETMTCSGIVNDIRGWVIETRGCARILMCLDTSWIRVDIFIKCDEN